MTETNIKKKWLKEEDANFLKLIGIVLLPILIMSYPVLKIKWAKRQATNLCDQAIIGQPIDGLEEKARELGLRVGNYKGGDNSSSQIYAWEGWIFARYFCDIDYSEGIVISKKVIFLD